MPATTSQGKAKKSKKTKQKEQKTGTHVHREHKGRKIFFISKYDR